MIGAQTIYREQDDGRTFLAVLATVEDRVSPYRVDGIGISIRVVGLDLEKDPDFSLRPAGEIQVPVQSLVTLPTIHGLAEGRRFAATVIEGYTKMDGRPQLRPSERRHTK